MRSRGNIMIGTMLLAAALPAQAQDEAGRANRLINELGRCRGIAAADARLACYETATAELLAARDKREVAIIDREGVREAKRGLFGFSLPRLPLFGGADGDGNAEPEVQAIEGILAGVAKVERTRWSLRLADGSTWQTTEQSRVIPRVGDTIRIETGILGSYKATVRDRYAGKVKRVR